MLPLETIDPNDIRAPFKIARVYNIFGTKPDVVRGKHAHRKLTQMAIVPIGSCTFLMDDGHTAERVTLDNPRVGLIIPPMVWHEMDGFSPDCVVTVLADAPYDEADYIRDRDEFLRLVRQ